MCVIAACIFIYTTRFVNAFHTVDMYICHLGRGVGKTSWFFRSFLFYALPRTRNNKERYTERIIQFSNEDSNKKKKLIKLG